MYGYTSGNFYFNGYKICEQLKNCTDINNLFDSLTESFFRTFIPEYSGSKMSVQFLFIIQ